MSFIKITNSEEIQIIFINLTFTKSQVRSASFDEIKLETQRSMQQLRHQISADERSDLLTVPQQHCGQRSRSFDSASHDDSAAAFLEVPKRFQRRRSSNSKTPLPCIHCQYLEEYEREVGADKRYFIDHMEVKSLSDMSSSGDDGDDSSDDDEGDEDDADDDEPKFGNLLLPPVVTSPGITFTLLANNYDEPEFEPSPPPFVGSPPASPCIPMSPTIEFACFDESTPVPRARRRSISRQEAVFVEPTGNSLENVADAEKNGIKRGEDDDGCDSNKTSDNDLAAPDIVQDIYLTVPDLKRDRAASVDSCFTKVTSCGKTEELLAPDGGFTLAVPVNSSAMRSRSVDIVLPTTEQARYKALALAGPSAAAYFSSRGYVLIFVKCFVNF